MDKKYHITQNQVKLLTFCYTAFVLLTSSETTLYDFFERGGQVAQNQQALLK